MSKKTDSMVFKINNIEENKEDFTLKDVTFIIMDEFKSENGQIVRKEDIENASKTLKDKPIVVRYFNMDDNDGVDALGDHEEAIMVDRSGNRHIGTDTIQIGHFTGEGYFAEHNDKEVLMCDGVLNVDRHHDIVGLLEEWIDNDIQINSSCEYYYCNYEVSDGVEYVKSPIVFSGHCILNSEKRGNKDVVLGAYSDSQLLSMNQKKAFNNIISKIKEEGSESMSKKFFIKMCRISHEDIRADLYVSLLETQEEDVYQDIFIQEVYDNGTFVYEIYEESAYKYYEANYTIGEDKKIVADLEDKKEVKRDWVAIAEEVAELEEEVDKLSQSINSKNKEIKTLNVEAEEEAEVKEAEIIELVEKAEESKTQEAVDLAKEAVDTLEAGDVKEDLVARLKVVQEDIDAGAEDEDVAEETNAQAEIEALHARILELEAVEKQYNDEKFAEDLEVRLTEFKAIFEALGALERFESEEIQELIAESIVDEDAMNKLNAIIVEITKANSEVAEEAEETDNVSSNYVKDLNSRSINNLVAGSNSVSKKYFN